MFKSLYIETPLYKSTPLSTLFGKTIFLKMENLQPSGSFKLRGISRLCQEEIAKGKKHLVSSSGGNAGFTAAYVGRLLSEKVTVFVPKSTPIFAINKIQSEGATVIVKGEVWDEAHHAALAFAKETDGAYIHPFDHPTIWSGYATMIAELTKQMDKPGAVVVSVGGGGLLCGVIEGLQKYGWSDVPVIGVETEGAASLAATIKAGKLVTLEKVNTIAVTLGTKAVTSKVLEWLPKHRIIPLTVSDKAAVHASRLFVDDHRMLVEPACGAALSVIYDKAEVLKKFDNIVVIVCGGIGISVDMLLEYENRLGVGAQHAAP